MLPSPAAILNDKSTRPLGYAWLIQQFQLIVMPPPRLSYISNKSRHMSWHHSDTQFTIYSKRTRAPVDDPVDHLLFAIQRDGINLNVLAATFRVFEARNLILDLIACLQDTPNGKSQRRLWFLYEFIQCRELPLPDLGPVKRIPLLDPDDYITGPERNSTRHRLFNNLLGNAAFCPIIRKTESLRVHSTAALKEQLDQVLDTYSPDVVARAIRYFYTKETMASFAIEREKPSQQRARRFVQALEQLDSLQTLDIETLVALQSIIVASPYLSTGYRTNQVYVAEMIGMSRLLIHFIAAQPQDVPELTEGLLQAVHEMEGHAIDPIIWAAAVSFGFVFIHPFADGNGRIHRFLIHYILKRAAFTPPGVIIPVSAVMLNRPREYDACLESFSKPLMRLLSYDEDSEGIVTVNGETADLYRYFDATRIAEDLLRWVGLAIKEEFQAELDFLVGFRKARAAMQEIVDLPDSKIQIFIRSCFENGGRLSQKKRKRHFSALVPDQLAELEEAVREAFGVTG